MIAVDNREPKEILEKIAKFNIETDYTLLNTGDYVIGDDWCWERKSMGDFIRCLTTGKIWTDVRKVKENYKYGGLILEGRLPTDYTRSEYMTLKRLRASMGSIRHDWGLSIDRTDNLDDTAMFLVSIHSRIGREKKKWYRPVKKQKTKSEDIISDLLCTLPNVGRVKAEQMLVEYGSVKNIINLSAKEFTEFKGISKDIGNRIYTILNLGEKKNE